MKNSNRLLGVVFLSLVVGCLFISCGTAKDTAKPENQSVDATAALNTIQAKLGLKLAVGDASHGPTLQQIVVQKCSDPDAMHIGATINSILYVASKDQIASLDFPSKASAKKIGGLASDLVQISKDLSSFTGPSVVLWYVDLNDNQEHWVRLDL